jgi:hypothetical protein
MEAAPKPFPQTIAKAMVAVMKKVESLIKDKPNAYGGFQYASVDDFYEMVRPIISAQGLLLMPIELSSTKDTIAGGRGGEMLIVTFEYSMMIVHESGDVWHNPEDKRHVTVGWAGAQTSGIALSYFDKQWMRSAFKIPTGEKDADAGDALQADATAAINESAKAKRAAGEPVDKQVAFKMPSGDTLALGIKEVVSKLSVELSGKSRAERELFAKENEEPLRQLHGMAKAAWSGTKKMLEAPDPRA